MFCFWFLGGGAKRGRGAVREKKKRERTRFALREGEKKKAPSFLPFLLLLHHSLSRSLIDSHQIDPGAEAVVDGDVDEGHVACFFVVEVKEAKGEVEFFFWKISSTKTVFSLSILPSCFRFRLSRAGLHCFSSALSSSRGSCATVHRRLERGTGEEAESTLK